MTEEERTQALNHINALIPKIVFDRFIMILTQIEEKNNDGLIRALDNICRNATDGFFYSMNTGESTDTITPIREALDLLEGWIITSQIASTEHRVKWEVDSIIGKEVK